MCWSENASYFSFVVGTITNTIAMYILIRDGYRTQAVMLLWWQFDLLMQIPEALEWRAIRLRRTSKFNTSLAFFLNVLQPLVAYLCVSAAIGRHDAISIVALFTYMLTFVHVKLPASIRPTDECPHLNLDWWPYWRALAYHITTLIVLRSLPTKDMLIHGAIFEATLLLSIATVKPCGVASVWCWSTFVAAITVLLVTKVTEKIPSST